MNNRLGFEKRKPYQAALELNRLAIQVCDHTTDEQQLLADELNRSAMALVQYVVGGYGAPDPYDKKQALTNAISTSYRLLSALLIARQHELITDEELDSARLFFKQIQRLR